VQNFLKSIPKGSKIIDIPVGTGRFFPSYEEHQFEVTGLDISQEMLDVASQKVRSERIHLKKGYSHELPFENNSFDFAICWRFLHLIDEKAMIGFFKELERVVKYNVLMQAYARDLYSSFMKRIKNLKLTKSTDLRKQEDVIRQWSHIKAHNHKESLIKKCLHKTNLKVIKKDRISLYKDKSLNAYTVSKNF
jgi:ubiquinone/menaquinone biosynthesis C-methylase UbiE